MSEYNQYSGVALSICFVCDFIWSITILAVCTYLVFWMDHSGWWYLLAMILCGMWNCRRYRSPDQMAADPDDNED
jgi:4-hydroxybenzoate polyprenyltransferase